MTPGVDHAMPLPPAMDAERRSLHDARSGALAYYSDERGAGAPLVLLHSVNAAASAYEMRPLFEHYRGRRPVHALDLPGFGFSQRGERLYTPALYAAAIEAFIAAVTPSGARCDVVALSLASEFAGAVAARGASPIRSLALIAPTGLARKTGPLSIQPPPERDARPGIVQRVLGAPRVGQPLFDVLVSRPSIRFFLGKSFAGPVDAGLLEYCYRTAHQPGARFAPLTFLSGRLFTRDARTRWYEAAPVPGLVLHDDAPFGGFGALPALLASSPQWQGLRIGPTRGLPHFERLDATAAALDAFWARA